MGRDTRLRTPEIGVGLLGHAFMGRAHSHAYKTLACMLDPPPAIPRLVAIAGRDQAAVSAAAARYGYERHYTDWRGLVNDAGVQLFDDVAANDAHLEPCLAAVAAGKHVVCEKPLARTAADEDGYRAAVVCDALARSAEEGVRVPIVH